MPHAGYSHDYILSVYDQVQACVDEALKHKHRIVIGGNFNTQLHLGLRGALLHDFWIFLAYMFRLRVANSEQNENSWTFCSSMRVKRRMDFILHSCDLNLTSACACDLLDLGLIIARYMQCLPWKWGLRPGDTHHEEKHV